MVPFLPWILKFDLFLAYMDFDFWNLSQSVVNLEIPLWWCVVLSSMGIGKEGKMVSCSMDFEIWYFVVNFSAEKYFSLSFRVGKMKFHHFCPPGKILLSPSGKTTIALMEKILLMLMAITIAHVLFWSGMFMTAVRVDYSKPPGHVSAAMPTSHKFTRANSTVIF